MLKPEILDKEVVDILTSRLQNEYNHHYFYQAASNWCRGIGFNKAADYFLAESNEELEHARGIEKYLVDWNVTPSLPIIKTPVLEFKNLAETVELSYKNEYELYELYEESSVDILKMGEINTFDFLQAYRKNQTDAVAAYSDMLNILEGTNADSKFEMLLIEENLF
jgi:ferritin